jgi:hypothetical protein
VTESERTEMIQEARIFAISAPVILNLLAKRMKVATELMMRDFREGKTDHIARVAEITLLGDLEREIRQKEALYLTMEKQT